MTNNERFDCFDDGDYYYIVDKFEHNKTLEEFKQDLIDNGYLEDGYTMEEIEEIADENQYEYLYDNTMGGEEVIDKLNELYNENQKLRQENQALRRAIKYIRK